MNLSVKKKLPLQWVYLLTIFVSISLDSRFSLPYETILRWVMPALLWFITFVESRSIPLVKNGLFWVMTLWFGITCFTSINIPYSVERYISLLLVCGAFYTYYSYLDGKDKLYDAVAILGVLYVVYGVLNFFFIQWGSGSRPTGLTGNANSLGGFGNIAMIFSYYYYRRVRKRKWIFIIAIAMSAVCAWMSASRSVAVCALMILSVILFLSVRGKARFVVLSVGIVLATGLLVLDNDVLLSIPGLQRLAEMGVVSEERSHMWTYGMSLIRQRPVIGWGYGVSTSLNTVVKGLAFHNSYLSSTIEIGVTGIVLLASFILTAVVKGYKLLFKTRNVELFIILAVLTDFMIIFFGESSLLSVGGSEGFLFWGCLMWLLVAIKKNASGSGDRV